MGITAPFFVVSNSDAVAIACHHGGAVIIDAARVVVSAGFDDVAAAQEITREASRYHEESIALAL